MSELFIFTWEGEGNIILEDCDKGHILVVSWNGWSCGTSLQSKKPIRYKRDKPDSLYCTSKPMAHIRVARRRAVIRHSSVYLQLKNRKPNSEETDMNSKRIGTLDNTANLLEQTIPADMDQVYHLVSNVWF